MAHDDQLALLAVATTPTTIAPRALPSTKPKKNKTNQQDIQEKETREEREQEAQAFWAGLVCRVPPRGVPPLWSCFGSNSERLMCSWCGWSFDQRTNEIKQTDEGLERGCPRCPVEHPELRPKRLPVDEEQEELFGDG